LKTLEYPNTFTYSALFLNIVGVIIKKLFQELQSVIKKLDLSVDATKYYAGWIVKAKVTQITDIVEPNKRYLYLVAFIDHYYKKCGLRAMAWLAVSIASL